MHLHVGVKACSAAHALQAPPAQLIQQYLCRHLRARAHRCGRRRHPAAVVPPRPPLVAWTTCRHAWTWRVCGETTSGACLAFGQDQALRVPTASDVFGDQVKSAVPCFRCTDQGSVERTPQVVSALCQITAPARHRQSSVISYEQLLQPSYVLRVSASQRRSPASDGSANTSSSATELLAPAPVLVHVEPEAHRSQTISRLSRSGHSVLARHQGQLADAL